MFIRIIVLTILMAAGFEKIKSQHLPGSPLWDSSEEVYEPRGFNKFVAAGRGRTGSKYDVSGESSEEVKDYGGKPPLYQKINQLPNIDAKQNIIPKSPSTFIPQPKEEAVKIIDESLQSNNSETFGDKFKRQTQINGSNNRFFSFLRLPVKLDVLANVLSVLNQDVVGSSGRSTINDATFISGNNNRVTNVLDVTVDVQAVLNILSNVNRNFTGSNGGNVNKLGLLDGLLGGEKGGLLGGLLGQGLGGTLEDVLAGLLGKDNVVGGLLGGLLGGGDHESGLVDGLLGPLLENLLEAVGNIVEELLELLGELLEAILGSLARTSNQGTTATFKGTGESANSLNGNNNQATSLINAPIKIRALINILTSFKQEIDKAIDPTAVLNSTLGGNVFSPSTGGSGGVFVQGNDNKLTSLINLEPDVNLELNVLSQIAEILNPGINGNGTNNGVSSGGSDNPNEICFDVPIEQSDTSAVGNKHEFTSLLNVKPKINLDLNILSNILKTGGAIPSNVPKHRICIPRPTTQSPPTTTTTTTTVAPTTNPNEVCFNVPVTPSGTAIIGNDNRVFNGVNVESKLNLLLNILSNVQKTGSSGSTQVKSQRICIPIPTTARPSTASPVTTSTPRPYPPTSEKRCYKRVCTRWSHSRDYKCLTNTDQYPKYTITSTY